MEIATNKKLTRFLMGLALIAFLFVTFFGLSHSIGMEKKADGTMSGCIFDGRVQICTMSVLGHISSLQSMFTATPEREGMLLLMLGLLLALAAVSFLRPSFARNSETISAAAKLYISQHPDIPLFNQLRQAFSSGILNPKIY